ERLPGRHSGAMRNFPRCAIAHLRRERTTSMRQVPQLVLTPAQNLHRLSFARERFVEPDQADSSSPVLFAKIFPFLLDPMYGPAARRKRFSSIWRQRSCINVWSGRASQAVFVDLASAV